MRSVQVSKPNGPFEIVERDIPEPGVGKVRIKVQAWAYVRRFSDERWIIPGYPIPKGSWSRDRRSHRRNRQGCHSMEGGTADRRRLGRWRNQMMADKLTN